MEEERKEGSGLEKSELDLERQKRVELAKNLLRDIFADRSSVVEKETHNSADYLKSFEDTCHEVTETVLTNVHLLHMLNGHQGASIRKLCKQSSSPSSSHIQSLYSWSTQVFDNGVLDTTILTQEPPALLALHIVEPSQLYERLLFEEKNPTTPIADLETASIDSCRRALNLPEGKIKKWIDLIPHIFNTRNPAALFSQLFKEVGYLPRDLTTRAAFKKVPFAALAACVNALRSLESGEYGDMARYERSRLLNAMIREGQISSLKDKEGVITIDSNGLFINTTSLHSHIPFGLLDEASLDALKYDRLMPADDVLEVGIRSNDENKYCDKKEKLEATQFDIFRKAVAEHHKPYDKSYLEKDESEHGKAELSRYQRDLALYEQIKNATPAESIKSGSFSYYLVGHIVKGGAIPDLVITEFLKHGESGIADLMAIAERVCAAFTNNKTTKRSWQGFMSHEMLEVPDEEYNILASMLHDPKYYSVVKIIKAILAHLPPNSEEKEFIAIRGTYKSHRGDQYSFFETMYKGQPSRILLSEDKHLRATERVTYRAAPEYRREEYQDLERALIAYNLYRINLERLRESKNIYLTADQDHIFHKNAKSALSFISGHGAPEDYREASQLFDKLEEAAFNEEGMTKYTQAFIDVAERVDVTYRKFVYSSIGKAISFVEKFMPEIKKGDIHFGDDFLEGARAACLPGNFDPELSAYEGEVRVVGMKYQEGDPTRTIPYHIEQDVLDSLRISSAPILNIIGGTAQMEGLETATMTSFATRLMNVAHEFKLNVAVPGTQSGIGALFGAANLRYKEETDHLPIKEQAHMFAVSPGGNTYYPGNEYLDEALKDQMFAMAPIDSVMTPFSVDWDAKGLAKRDSSYNNHVAYAGAFISRAGANERRVSLVVNGGFYTLMELMETYRRGFTVFFVKDSGRLASFLAAYQDHRSSRGLTVKTTDEEMYDLVMKAVKQLPDDVGDEFLRKDFGSNVTPENDDVLVYREYLYSFMKMLDYGQDMRQRYDNGVDHKINIVTLESAEEALATYYKDPSEKGKNIWGLTPVPSIRKW